MGTLIKSKLIFIFTCLYAGTENEEKTDLRSLLFPSEELKGDQFF